MAQNSARGFQSRIVQKTLQARWRNVVTATDQGAQKRVQLTPQSISFCLLDAMSQKGCRRQRFLIQVRSAIRIIRDQTEVVLSQPHHCSEIALQRTWFFLALR